MSDEKNDYDSEMRGVLYDVGERKGDKYPVATGKIQISGVELRIAMWPAQVSKGESKKKYWPVKVEYKQGATKFLAPVSPANVTVTAATAGGSTPGAPEVADIDDMPI